LDAGAALADEDDRAGLAVDEEGVGEEVVVSGNKSLLSRAECDESSVGCQGADQAVPADVALGWVAGGAGADPLGDGGLAVVYEHVDGLVGVAGDEIVAEAVERDDAPLRADLGGERPLGDLRAVARDADPFGRVQLAVAYEDVAGEVRVTWDEVVAEGRERDVAPVGADRGLAA